MIQPTPSLGFVFALTGLASAVCDRPLLASITSNYLRAQVAGRVSSFSFLSNNTIYLERDKPVQISTSTLSVPLKIDAYKHILDTTTCTTFTEIIVATSPKQYVIGTRLEISPITEKVTKFETLSTEVGDWAFNATGYLQWNSLEKWDEIPASKRDSRAVIQGAGDAYFDRFDNINVTVPFGTPCARLEGGAYTGTRGLETNTCDLGLPSTVKVEARRYVVDEVMGVAVLWLYFPGLDAAGTAPSPDSHMFRVEGGKIRYVHTLSICEHPGCGTNGTIPLKKRGGYGRKSTVWDAWLQASTGVVHGQSVRT